MTIFWLRNTNCYTLEVATQVDAWRQRLVWDPAGDLHAFRCIESEVLDDPSVLHLVTTGLLTPDPEHHAFVMKEDLAAVRAAYVERFRSIIPEWAPVASAVPAAAPAVPVEVVETAVEEAVEAAPADVVETPAEAPAAAATVADTLPEAPLAEAVEAAVEAPVEAPATDAPADAAEDTSEGPATSVLPTSSRRKRS